ncbi:MAG: MATE family efflux transporter [Clostridiales bacterium]|nr:MATE family efflux transporter [Clostridiales bacterium]
MRKDMTAGTEWKQIALFSFPIMAGNILQQLYNTVDGIVVGNFVNESALAAVGTCGVLSFLFLSLSMGLGNGAGIMIAQFFGAKRMHELKSSMSTSLILLVSIGAVLSVFGIFAGRWLLSGLMNVKDPVILDYAAVYFEIYAVGFILQFAYNAVAAILRAVGDSKATLLFLFVSAFLNLGLDLLFVITFNWGVAGAAVATVISQVGSTVVSIIYMFRRYPQFRFSKGEFVFDPDKGKLCLRLGIPTTIQQCIVSFGNVFIQRLVNSFGSVTMAAYTVGSRIENYLFVPTMGFFTGMSTFTAQNIGAGKIDRIKRGLVGTGVLSASVCIILSVSLYIFSEPVSRLFGVSDDALAQAVEFCRFYSKIFILFAAYMPVNALLQGSGDVIYASSTTMTTLIVRVAMAYVMALLLDVGYSSCWKSTPIGWSAAVVMAFARYASGRWKTKSIVKRPATDIELQM